MWEILPHTQLESKGLELEGGIGIEGIIYKLTSVVEVVVSAVIQGNCAK